MICKPLSLTHFHLSVLALLLTIPYLSGAEVDFEAKGWDEIPEEEFAAETPRIDPDAPIEFLYRKLHVDDDGDDTIFKYHYRLKVYTQAGVDELDKIDLEYASGW
jgi:hypothetical protein